MQKIKIERVRAEGENEKEIVEYTEPIFEVSNIVCSHNTGKGKGENEKEIAEHTERTSNRDDIVSHDTENDDKKLLLLFVKGNVHMWGFEEMRHEKFLIDTKIMCSPSPANYEDGKNNEHFAHCVVLASRSKYMKKAMKFQSFKDGFKKTARVPNIRYDTMELLLYWMYGSAFIVKYVEDLKRLIDAAFFLECEDFLEDICTKENCLDLWLFAETSTAKESHACQVVGKEAYKLVLRHFDDLVQDTSSADKFRLLSPSMLYALLSDDNVNALTLSRRLQ
jgi:hypothetical protein